MLYLILVSYNLFMYYVMVVYIISCFSVCEYDLSTYIIILLLVVQRIRRAPNRIYIIIIIIIIYKHLHISRT